MLDQDPSLPTALVDFPGPEGLTGLKGEPGPRQRWRFDRPRQWLVAHDALQVPALLDAAHALSKEGAWCVGWVAYEAAPGLDPHLPVKALPIGQPYAVWAVFDQAQPWSGQAIQAQSPTADTSGPHAAEADLSWQLGPWQSDLDGPAMQTQVERIRELIRAGEVYQINLTSQHRSAYQGAPASLWPCFDALRRSQPHGYSLMLDARAASRSPGAVLSVSPELFVDWDGQALVTRPMKGTAARSADAQEDAQAAEHLRSSPKERAENLMIVDLLRNDLSRIAEVGSVRAPALFDVQALPTVWQMTSTVTARSRPGLRLSEVFAALFPCGSVTGAPKRQAMHHIARLERSARGVYCGAVGLMQPGGRVTFNVPIRTVCIGTPPPPAPWSATAGIGSGITLDATGPQEAAEWRSKQAFLRRAQAPFSLIESMRLENGLVHRWDRHLARLQASIRHFGWVMTAPQAAALQADVQAMAQGHPQGVFKLRLLWKVDGTWTLQAQALSGPGVDAAATIRVGLAQQAMKETGDFILHKTTQRAAYEAFPPAPGCFDTLLFNPRGELSEFTIGNLVVRLDGQWFTPPMASSLLPGVMRQDLLQAGRIHERVLHHSDLAQAQGVALVNSVRGWLEVDLAHLQAQVQAQSPRTPNPHSPSA